MAACLGKNCSYGLPRVSFVSVYLFVCVFHSAFDFEDEMWDLILSVPDYWLSVYF